MRPPDLLPRGVYRLPYYDESGAAAGIDMLRHLASRERLHFASDEIYYIIELVDPVTQETTARYGIFTRHKYRRNSTINWTHAAYRLLEERDYLHKTVFAARMGPWQAGSAFGRQLGFPLCPQTAPTFVLYPHRSKRVAGFADDEGGVGKGKRPELK